MTAMPLLFDAVLFDLDGTLVATDRFWVDAARAGARRAFEELGIAREMPSAQEWMSMVGLPLAQGFERVFADLAPDARALVMRLCEEEEHQALRSGHAALLPGVAATLDDLTRRGVRLGIASNCGQGYLDAMLGDLGLARWVQEARCLDSKGVRNKADMLADLLATFGTRSAVMVGDRLGDRDAAWENGLPHVHLARGFAQPGEEVEAEAVIETMADLVPRLLGRTRWIEGALETLGFTRGDAPRVLGVTGAPGSGKQLVARDAARLLAERGLDVQVLDLEQFLRVGAGPDLASTAFVAAQKPLDLLPQGYDLASLGLRLAAVPPGEVAVLHGPFLLHPLLRPRLARVLHLEADDAVCLRRLAGRDARASGPEILMKVRRQLLPASRGFDALVPPREHADLVLDGGQPLGA